MMYYSGGKMLTYKQASGFRHRRNKFTKPEDLESGVMPVESPFALAAELAMCDTSPVHSALPTRAATPDLDQHPELRAITSHEEDILFFGSAMDPNAAPRLASERGALARPNPIMEALLRMERANAMAANANKDLEMGVVEGDKGKGKGKGARIVVGKLVCGPAVKMVLCGVLGFAAWVCLAMVVAKTS